MTAMAMTNPTRIVRRAPRPGFAFTEILFAVMVLALGFIMIAAMFPVTIRQTQSTVEETSGAHLAKGAVDYLQSIASDDMFPYTVKPLNATKQPDPNEQARVLSFRDIFTKYGVSVPQPPPAWGKEDPNPTLNDLYPAYYTVRGNMINPNNPREAWIPFYRRAANSQVAQVIVVAVQSRNREQYVAQYSPYRLNSAGKVYTDFERPVGLPPGMTTGTAPATLEPLAVTVDITYDAVAGHGVAQIDTPGRGRAAPGAYLIVSLDTTAPPKSLRVGQSTGRVYQLGNAIDEAAGTWELTPGSDMIRTNANPTVLNGGDDNDIVAGTAYLIGRGYADPTDATQGYAGPAQDIAVYTGFINIPPTPTP